MGLKLSSLISGGLQKPVSERQSPRRCVHYCTSFGAPSWFQDRFQNRSNGKLTRLSDKTDVGPFKYKSASPGRFTATRSDQFSIGHQAALEHYTDSAKWLQPAYQLTKPTKLGPDDAKCLPAPNVAPEPVNTQQPVLGNEHYFELRFEYGPIGRPHANLSSMLPTIWLGTVLLVPRLSRAQYLLILQFVKPTQPA